ncbi:MAG TPA: hypothetical protein VFG10_03580 [Saprospiraceae bacterium]|nr:hypothetical protein [Saprospiraceae bacterium]
MIKALKISLLTLLQVYSLQVNAQKYTEGVYEFGLISLERTPDSPIDSITLPLMKANVEAQLAYTVYFTKDLIAIEKTDPLGSDIRGVYDFQNHKVYEFKNISDQPGFTQYDIPEHVPISDSENEILSKIKSAKGEIIAESIFGLSGTKYEIEQNGSNFTLILTKDILVQDIQSINPLPLDVGTIIQFSMIEQGLKITMGMKSFSPVIPDRNIFSIDTIGLMNFTKQREALQESLKEMHEEDKIKKEKYGDYKPHSSKNDIIHNLAEEGALDKDNWKVSQALENHTDYDIPSIVVLALDEEKGMAIMDRSSLKKLFTRYDMLSPTLEYILSDKESKWNKIPDHLKYSAICIASIKDLLNNHFSRGQIASNLTSLDLLDPGSDSVARSYLEGKAPLKDLLNEVNIFTRLKDDIAITDDDIYKHVAAFFDIVSSKMGTHLMIERHNTQMTVKNGDASYYVDINSLKEPDYSKTDEDEPPTIFLDTTKINEEFYQKLLDVVKQLGADQNTGMAYSIYRLHPPFVREIPEYDYDEIVEAYPWIRIDENAIYFQQFPKKDYEFLEGDIGCSFPYHPDADYQEVTIGNFKIGDIDAGIDYVTSNQKKAFIDYLKKYHQDFGVPDENLTDDINDIEQSLIKGSDDLLRYLKNIRITVENIFDITPRSEYHPKFTTDKNDFKDAYYAISRVIGDDFPATNFFYESEAHKVRFVFNGQEYRVDPGDRNMIRFIQANMKKTKSGKQLYPVRSFSVTHEEYFYLTPEQKLSLSKIIPINF